MNDNEIIKLLKEWATPDESFREDLLQRCLKEIDQDGEELDDDTLDLLAAAGDPHTLMYLDSQR